VDAPGGKTAYLAELGAGAEVLVVGPTGSSHAAVVGRAKVEARPLLRVDAVAVDGVRVSVMLQNAETVRLVAPQGMGRGAVATPPPAKLSRAGSASLEVSRTLRKRSVMTAGTSPAVGCSVVKPRRLQ
jgi:hypothetical protein